MRTTRIMIMILMGTMGIIRITRRRAAPRSPRNATPTMPKSSFKYVFFL